MPRDGTATKVRILDAAERLFETNGFAATSVDAIIEASGTSKGAFFHHFESKRALSQALVERYVEVDLTMLQAGLDAVAHLTDPVERVLGFLRYYERWATELVSADSACLYLAVLTEKDLLDESTAGAVERAIVAWRVEFAALIRAALAARGLRRRISPDDLADHLFATFEGGYLLCRSLRSAEPMRAQLRVMRQLVEALLVER
jgi:TetR/AcrR family transcriptional regulator, transcriptional repressor for nem operon